MGTQLIESDTELAIKNNILSLVKDYYLLKHANNEFVPGKTKINYAGRVFDENEMINIVDSALDFWLTSGHFAERFEGCMREFFGSKGFYLVNSGSSANLVMITALCSNQFDGHLRSGDEVITPAVTFPTTLTPLIQNGLVPVFVDCEVGTYNINPNLIEGAVSSRTRAIFVPHTLGNPCNMKVITEVADRHGLILIEDACDALGAIYGNKVVGSFGIMASLSFYPAHHITMGEGGGVVVNDASMLRIVSSIRDWGRDCWCKPGQSDTCGKRFSYEWDELPSGYDHKYVYSNLGYNLKVTDMQAAVGMAQLDKANKFIEMRKKNFNFFFEKLAEFEDRLILPKWEKESIPSWFGFPITTQNSVDTAQLIRHLEAAKIETRKVFAGNICKQPGFKGIPRRIYGELKETDKIMRDTFFIGVWPGLTEEMRDYMVKQFVNYFKR